MISIMDIPLLNRAVMWGDSKIRDAVEYIVRKYAEFERAAVEAPAIAEDAQAMYQTLQVTNGTPQQLSNARKYVEATVKLTAEVANRGVVDQVVQWARGVLGGSVGALPLVPVAIASAALVAVAVVANTIKNYNEAKLIRGLVAAGLTPQQVAMLASRRNPFSSGLVGASSAISLIAIGAVVFFGWRALRGSR